MTESSKQKDRSKFSQEDEFQILPSGLLCMYVCMYEFIYRTFSYTQIRSNDGLVKLLRS
jgi:hypothetical protein